MTIHNADDGLRGWLQKVAHEGDLRVLNGVDRDGDLGPISDVAQHRKNGPAVLFDEIPGFAPGYRILVNSLGSANRIAITLGLPLDLPRDEFMEMIYERVHRTAPIPPVVVDSGPVMANVLTGDDVNLESFPTPLWHELDGGRYIGTGCAMITRDPDHGVVNLGTYRIMTIDRSHATVYISPGKHGRLAMEAYLAAGKPCPVVLSIGHDPLIFLASGLDINEPELDFIGGIQGKPLPVINGAVTGLPFPAESEIVLEGFIQPDATAAEGPFGEWTGYYSSGVRQEPVLEIEAVYHRDSPILLGSPPTKPPNEHTAFRGYLRSAMIRKELEAAGVPDVHGVWAHECGGTRLFLAVSIRQRYPGHATQAALIAAACHAGNYLGRYVVVVDDDIDVSDLNDVMWAVCTRSEPSESIDIIRRAWSGPLDPRIRPGKKGFNSRAIIDATRPYDWADEFPPVVGPSPQLRREVLNRWGDILFAQK